MKRFKFNARYMSISLYAIFVIACAIIMEKIIGNLPSIGVSINSFFKTVYSVTGSFIYGFFIAYFLNSVVRGIEFHLINKIAFFNKRLKLRRVMSVIITFVIFIGSIVWIIAYLVPEIISSMGGLITNISNSSANYSNFNINGQFLDDLLNSINGLLSTQYNTSEIIHSMLSPIMTTISGLPFFINKIWSGTFSFANQLLKFIVGLIIAFYMLCDKELFARAFTKILYTIFRHNTAHKLINGFKDSNLVFEKFVIGKAIDSLIIGIMFFIICLITKMPYSVLLSIIIGVTNMIPYFGPFIGAIPVILIVLLNDPVKALIISICILILQQFDGIVLGPKIIGDSTGLRPIEVIFAITVGGATAGFLGMFLGVPVFAVIKTMFNNMLNKQYNSKYQVKD